MFAIKTLACAALLTLSGINSADASPRVPVLSSQTHAESHSSSKMANVSGVTGITVIYSFLKTPAGALTSAVLATSGSPLPPHTSEFSICKYLENVSRAADTVATIGWVVTKAAGASGVEQVAIVTGVVTAGATAIAAPTQVVVWVVC